MYFQLAFNEADNVRYLFLKISYPSLLSDFEFVAFFLSKTRN